MESSQQKDYNQTNDENELMDNLDAVEMFHILEKECIGYENFVNCDDKHFTQTLENLRKLVIKIQKQSLFSPNEEIKEIQTENIKLLMTPYYEADVLFRLMDKRHERVKMAQVFYIEYLKLLNHYGVLEKDQVKEWKRWMKRHKVQAVKERKDATAEEVKEAQELLKELHSEKLNQFEDREAKIAEFKLKKLISQQLDQLKDYRDEEKKREIYMLQIKRSIIISFEQLRIIEMELELLKHRESLTPEQIEQNVKLSQKPEPGSLPPLQIQHITKESLSNIPYLMKPQSDDFANTNIVNNYKDPMQRVVIQKETIDQQFDLRQQYQNQVFKPGHNQPTKSLEQLADEEYADAMRRQEQEQEAELQRQMEDPESEEVLERERQKTMKMEDWKDYVPKGRGVTKRI